MKILKIKFDSVRIETTEWLEQVVIIFDNDMFIAAAAKTQYEALQDALKYWDKHESRFPK